MAALVRQLSSFFQEEDDDKAVGAAADGAAPLGGAAGCVLLDATATRLHHAQRTRGELLYKCTKSARNP